MDLYGFTLVRGDVESALLLPYTMLITESAALRMFGESDVVGKTVEIEDRYFGGDYRVVGVLEDLPTNTILNFDFLHSTRSKDKEAAGGWEAWNPATEQVVLMFVVVMVAMLVLL